MEITIILSLLVLGYFLGKKEEKKHYKSIRKREEKLLGLPALNFKKPPCKEEEVASSILVTGSTVVAIDYFKRFMASLKILSGGQLTTYESLLDRARREAILRMKESAGNVDLIYNVRIETSSIGQGSTTKGGVGSVEVLAYGTALRFK